MRLFKTIFAIASVGAIAIAAESCSKESADRAIEFDTHVDSIGYIVPDYFGDTIYTAAKYSVVWPEKVGQEDFDDLRDSLLVYTFGTTGASGFDEAAGRYMLSGVEDLRQENDTAFRYSTVPYDVASNADRHSFISTTSDVTLLTPALLVVQVYNYSYYFGAAHGMQNVRYLNYDIAARKLLTVNNIFKPGNETALLDLINTSARKHYPEEGALFPDPIQTLSTLQLTEDEIVFVYQPYDVAPYSTGIVRVPVNIFDLHRFLTPEAAALFADS